MRSQGRHDGFGDVWGRLEFVHRIGFGSWSCRLEATRPLKQPRGAGLTVGNCLVYDIKSVKEQISNPLQPMATVHSCHSI